ncbi:MAG: NAD-dependent epimerase/dehydratase family protein [Tumebacillaceae bacterium]
MKVLVTGGAGFIGSHIVEECMAAGHQVIVLDDLSTGKRGNLPDGVPLHVLSITDDAAERVIAEEGIEAIIHCAAQVGVPTSIADPLHDADINVIGTVKLLQAARKHGIKKFVFCSSAAVYGNPDYLPVDEEHPLRPMSFYGLSKKVAEEYIRMYHELFGVPYISFRFANVYGPRQSDGEGSVIPVFINKMLNGQDVPIQGSGEATRDFIYVGDLARANVAAIESDVVGTFNLGTETEVSVKELAAVLAKLTGYDRPPVHVAARVGDIDKSTLKNGNVIAALPWRPNTALEEGLQATIAWGREMNGTDR